MKKIFLLALTVIMVMSFAACASTTGSQSAQPTQSQEPDQSDAQNTDNSISTQSSVEIVDGNVVETRNTGDIEQVFTYHFKDGGVVSANIKITCGNEIEAQTMYDVLQKTNASFQTYEDLKIEGNVVTANYSSTAVGVYSDKTAEQLKTYLEESSDTE